ncbi:glycosyltransferase family 2 protein [Rhizobium sp. TRM96647]|uniref:glycosyltransferase family 2 protein n=1 Tax=unclassified Rhizobium TaxID=2613769 RepID=UPI0021E815EB|nr:MULTISPECIES: glycosyltransferase family 2 protein [unclassified Rhizobium]MCV3736657.1 glycosyltransferase family 2 protein [Rhizobium sp. TRM96647]MCV3759026.1 glycosyltransferase family 2 protein [Rhizobium sp. TRM96650]
MDFDSALKMIREAAEFDSEWYLRKYQDVQMLGLDPAYHFLRYGRLLGRSPGPGFDTKFYLDTYQRPAGTDASPLIEYLCAEDKDSRATTADRLQEQMQALHHSSLAAWKEAGSADERNPIISYCVPVMGRLEDLRGTLEFNLIENSRFADDVEFLVIEFGEQGDVREWIEEKFPDELQRGYLRVVTDKESLDTWHFGKAKNAFRRYLRGLVYSSLDGDNFVTAGETEQLLKIFQEFPHGFVFHHFTGEWGDGTSGRVSMLTSVYRSVGYDPLLLPRQFDEMDLILGALRRFPAMPFIGVNSDRNVFTQSAFAQSFFQEEKLANRKLFVGNCDRKAPLNPRGASYTEETPYLRDMNNFNANSSAFRHGISPKRKQKYLDRISRHKHLLAESLPKEVCLSTFFRTSDIRPMPAVDRSDICLFACVHDEGHFLPKLVEHYRKIGVARFFFVDDGSQVAVSDLALGKDVYSFRPKVGTFRTSKTLWLEALMKAFVPEDGWVVTVDADEFIQLPEPFADLREVTVDLDRQGLDFAPALLLDLVPSELDSASMENVLGEFDSFFDSFCYREGEPSEAYQKHPSVRWGFGSHSAVSWAVDTRFHAFETFDSLRKLPLFRYRSNRHLNQGFHTFHYLDGTSPPGHEIWTVEPILPIFHYKLVRLFSEASRNKMLEMSGGYHARTNQNIARIFDAKFEETVANLTRLSEDFRPKGDAATRGLFTSLRRQVG